MATIEDVIKGLPEREMGDALAWEPSGEPNGWAVRVGSFTFLVQLGEEPTLAVGYTDSASFGQFVEIGRGAAVSGLADRLANRLGYKTWFKKHWMQPTNA